MSTPHFKFISRTFIFFAMLASLLGSAVFVTPAYAAGIVVDSNADDALINLAGNGFCDLREAIEAANTDVAVDACTAGSGADSISFDASLSGQTILAVSQLELLEDVILDGSSLASKITISGGNSTRVFLVASGVTATLDSLIVTQGRVEGCCGAGLLNYGALTITNSLFSANNNNNGSGGAIMNIAPGALTLTGSTISGNSASNGGGIGNENQMTITNSTISANSSGDAGGGIHNNGATATLTVTNSTFSGNTASTNGFGSGGGIFSSGPLTVTNSTFSGNSAQFDAGGIAQDAGTLNLSNTIIANSSVVDTSSETDCRSQSAIGINLNNLVEYGGQNCSSPLNVEPNLGPLADNDGPTQTFALLANSPAIDAGDDATCATSEVNNLDQRDITRPNGGHCDIGAYEYVDTTAPTITAFSVPASPTMLNIPITTFTASDDAILTGYLITESATPPLVGDSGWTATAPTIYPVASMGSYTLYAWVKDAAGHVSANSSAAVNITCLTPITVTSSANSGADTLRQALADACVGDLNNISLINFDSALSGSTIHLASELTIDKNVTIDGSGLASQLTISGDDSVRVFNIPTIPLVSLTITLDSLIVTQGATSGHGAGIYMGQGMHVTITNSTFSDNHAGGRGGGIGNQGSLTLIDSTISGNSAASPDGGGGISNESGLTMTNSTISNNSATGATASGGGLFNTGGATITNSTIFGNSSNVYGGGISTTANLTLTNSTIAGNSAYATGGLQVDGNVTHLRNTIIANNTSTTINSLIHNDCSDTSDYPNPPTPDGDGIMTNLNSLIEDGSCSPSVSGDPNLGPLANNGGSTQTMALLAGSDAIDAGDDTICAGTSNPNPVNSLDQRGITRPDSAHCDIGAFEYADASNPAVTAFTVPSLVNSLAVPITIFTASDDATVASYLITQASTQPSAFAPGWTALPPTTYTVGGDGSYTLYPWAKDALNNVSAVFALPASVSVDATAPAVVSISRVHPSPTAKANVQFLVTFSESVSGVSSADFSLTQTGISGASATDVTGSGTTRMVTVNTGLGDGTLRLDIPNTATITDLAGSALSGLPFITGQAYTINKTLIYISTASQDGWILESTETSNLGGMRNTAANTFFLGDGAADKQYRAFLSFNTNPFPDNATITSVTLKIKRPATGFLVGNNSPFIWGLGLKADVCKPFFGATGILQLGDFNYTHAVNCKLLAGTFGGTPSANWYSANLLNTTFAKVNKTGVTQFRLRFAKDDNDDHLDDYLKFYSGSAPVTDRPQLVIRYNMP